MKYVLFLVMAFFIKLSCSESSENNSVSELSDSNFDESLRSKEFMVIIFYATWCGHCKIFDPIFVKTASTFKSRGMNNILFGRIDAAANTQISGKYNIDKYPIIKIFGKGNTLDYNGNRSELDFLNWISIQVNKGPNQVKSIGEINELIKTKEVLICFFGNHLTVEFLYFESASKQLANEYDFYYCDNEECKESFKAKDKSLVIFKNFDEKRADYQVTTNYDNLVRFLEKYSTRRIMSLNDHSIDLIFEKEIPALILIKDTINVEKDLLKDICESTRVEDKIILKCIEFELSSSLENNFADFIGLVKSEVPSIRLVQYNKNTGFLTKFKLENHLTIENVKSFVENWQNKQLKPYYKSEPVPQSYFTGTELVQEVVGDTFKWVILNEMYDAVILFYVPGCESCQDRELMFIEAAQRLKHIQSLVFGKIDSSRNEIENVSEIITHYPSIKIFSNGKKSTFYDYEGETILEDYIKWIKSHVSFPFEEAYKNEL